MNSPHKNATMKDIAKLCNVSPMAVSKVLGGKGGISKKTSEKILAAAKKLRYRPNLIAKSLRTNATQTLGLVISDSSPLLFARMIRSIGDAADAHDYSIIMANTGQSPEREKKSIRSLMEKRIDGLLLAAPINVDKESMDEVKSRDLPAALLMRFGEPEYDAVLNDNFLGARHMVDYLAETGSKRIYMINLPRDSQTGKERLRGYRHSLKAHGMQYRASDVLYCQPYIEDGMAMMERLIRRGVRSGAVFCGCDVIAIGAMRAAINAGLRIPDDIRISGYDDIELLDDLRVPLTTMRQPVHEIGATGVELLLQRIRQPDSPPKHVVIPSKLVIRAST